MDKPWFPDVATSRAVLIGVSRFRSAELPAIPAVRANLTDLSAVLTDTVRGCLSADGCHVLDDDISQAGVGVALGTASKEAADLLLVYFSGHGLVDEDGRLYLALRDTDPAHLGWTAIPIELVKRELGQARAKARVLILDCCFSGQAVEAMADAGSLAAGQLRLTGTFTLTSTTANDPSHAPRGARNTAFTRALLRALAKPKPLTLEGIYRHTDEELAGLGLPRPQCRSLNTVRDLMLVKGQPRAASATVEKPPPKPKPTAPGRGSGTRSTGPKQASRGRPSPVPRQRSNATPTATSEETARSRPPRTATPEIPRPKAADPRSGTGNGLVPRASLPERGFVLTHATPRWRLIRNTIGVLIAAVLSVISFTDPYRNISPSWFDILVGTAFGVGFACAAVAMVVPVVLWLRDARRSAPWRGLVLSQAGVGVMSVGARQEFPWHHIDRVLPARVGSRPAPGDPTIVIGLRPAAPRPARPGLPRAYADQGLVGLGQSPAWRELFAALLDYAPPAVRVERDVTTLR